MNPRTRVSISTGTYTQKRLSTGIISARSRKKTVSDSRIETERATCEVTHQWIKWHQRHAAVTSVTAMASLVSLLSMESMASVLPQTQQTHIALAINYSDRISIKVIGLLDSLTRWHLTAGPLHSSRLPIITNSFITQCYS